MFSVFCGNAPPDWGIVIVVQGKKIQRYGREYKSLYQAAATPHWARSTRNGVTSPAQRSASGHLPHRMATRTSSPTTGVDNASCVSLELCTLAPTGHSAGCLRTPAPVGAAEPPRPRWCAGPVLPRAMSLGVGIRRGRDVARLDVEGAFSGRVNVRRGRSTGHPIFRTFNGRNGSLLSQQPGTDRPECFSESPRL